jgi:hypothetical protein
VRTLELAQQHDGRVAGQLDPDADDLHLDHPRTIAPPSPGLVPIDGRSTADRARSSDRWPSRSRRRSAKLRARSARGRESLRPLPGLRRRTELVASLCPSSGSHRPRRRGGDRSALPLRDPGPLNGAQSDPPPRRRRSSWCCPAWFLHQAEPLEVGEVAGARPVAPRTSSRVRLSRWRRSEQRRGIGATGGRPGPPADAIAPRVQGGDGGRRGRSTSRPPPAPGSGRGGRERRPARGQPRRRRPASRAASGSSWRRPAAAAAGRPGRSPGTGRRDHPAPVGGHLEREKFSFWRRIHRRRSMSSS